MDAKKRFLKKVIYQDDGCWGWSSSVDSRGRPQFYLDKKRQSARRAAWKIFKDPSLPPSHYLYSVCRSNTCVNPDHMRPSSNRRNDSRTTRIRNGIKPDANGCWIWQRSTSTFGYGKTQFQGVSTQTHRLAWEAFNGPIPDGAHVCHKCDVPECCNPEHLFLGTPADNMADKATKGRSNTPKGEAHKDSKLTPEDVYKIRDATGPQKDIAKIYGIGPDVVSRIKNRKAWAHLPERAI